MHKRAPRNIHPQKVNLDNWQKTVRRMWNYLSNYRWKLLLVFGLTVVTTAVTIIGNRMNGIIVDQYIDKNRLRALIAVCIFLAIIYFISSIFTYFQNSIIIKVAQATSNQIRQDVFGNLQRQDVL